VKVVFTFSGLPHYLRSLLNKLVTDYGIEVIVIIPEGKGAAIGEGVRLADTRVENSFHVRHLQEYQGILRKSYFKALAQTLEDLSPSILVIGWPHIVNYLFDIRSRRIVRRNNISLVFREIPFMVAPRSRAIRYYRQNPVINEDLETENPGGIRFYLWAFLLNQLRKRYYRLADATMSYTSQGREIHRSFRVPEEDIFVTYNSPDTDRLSEVRKKLLAEGISVKNAARVLHLGRLVRWKRVDLLIEAVSQLSEKHENIEMYVIGEGPEEENLRSLAKRLIPEGHAVFLGSIYDPEELGRQIMYSGMYVLAGMGGLSINEAMAFGKPVICSQADGTEKDLVTDGVNGLFFSQGDATDLASKIDRLLTDPETLRRMGEESLSVIRDRINLDSVAKRYMDCFRHVVSR
jgi:glycosyltransferase involved in cell wall biosynthesis